MFLKKRPIPTEHVTSLCDKPGKTLNIFWKTILHLQTIYGNLSHALVTEAWNDFIVTNLIWYEDRHKRLPQLHQIYYMPAVSDYIKTLIFLNARNHSFMFGCKSRHTTNTFITKRNCYKTAIVGFKTILQILTLTEEMFLFAPRKMTTEHFWSSISY